MSKRLLHRLQLQWLGLLHRLNAGRLHLLHVHGLRIEAAAPHPAASKAHAGDQRARDHRNRHLTRNFLQVFQDRQHHAPRFFVWVLIRFFQGPNQPHTQPKREPPENVTGQAEKISDGQNLAVNADEMADSGRASKPGDGPRDRDIQPGRSSGPSNCWSCPSERVSMTRTAPSDLPSRVAISLDGSPST